MTDSAPHLKVAVRDMKRSPKALRRDGLVPANVSGLSTDSLSLTCSQSDFHSFIKNGGETGLLYLNIEGKKQAEPALVDEVQYHPSTSLPLHITFRRVNLQEKITADVPLEFVGFEDIKGANLVKVREEVEIEALPADIPEHIEVDLSGLVEIGQSVLLKDLVLDPKIKLTADEEDLDKPVALLQEQVEEVEPEVEPEAEVEADQVAGGEAVKEGATSSGDQAKSDVSTDGDK